MEFEVLCTNCDTSYEASVTKVMRDPEVLNCPQCNEHADVAALEAFRDALEAFFSEMAEISPIMTFAMEIDSSRLPAPFGDPDEDDEEDDEDGDFEIGDDIDDAGDVDDYDD